MSVLHGGVKGLFFFALKIVKLEAIGWGKEFTRKETVAGLFKVCWNLMMNIQTVVGILQ